MTLALEMASGTPSSPLDDDNDANDSCIVKIAPTISLRILEDVSSSSSDNSDADADDDDNAELVVEDGNNNKTDYNVDDKVEDSVYKIWTRQRSDFNKDLDYVTDVVGKDIDQRLGTSSFAALAVSRDGGNLFVPERLEEIRTRMEETENTTVRCN